MKGHFVGTYWTRRGRIDTSGLFGLTPHPYFGFKLDHDNPLTFIGQDADGTEVWQRCCATDWYVEDETDFGSVPPEFQSEVGPLDSPNGYVMHDKDFKNHGWFESRDKGKTWQYVAKTEDEVNSQLFDWAEADGVDWVEREEMYEGVEVGGTKLWNSHTGPFPVDPPPEPQP